MKKLTGVAGLYPYLKKKRGTIAFFLFQSVVNAVLSLMPIQFIAAIVDLLSTGQCRLFGVFEWKNGENWMLLVLFGVSYLLQYYLDSAYGRKVSLFAYRLIEEVRQDAFGWVLENFRPYKEERKEGDIVSRLTGDVEAVLNTVAGPLNGLLPMLLKMAVSLIVLFVWNASMGMIAVLLIVPLYCLSRWITVQSGEIAKSRREAQGSMINEISNILYTMPVIRAWGKEEYENGKFFPFNHKIFQYTETLQRKFLYYWLATYTVMGIGMIGAMVMCAGDVKRGVLGAGSLVVAYTYLGNVLNPIIALSRYGNEIAQSDAALRRVFELKKKGAEGKQDLAEEAFPSDFVRLSFQNVMVRCSDTKQVGPVSFDAKKEEITVFTGASGSGKTTLFHAIMGFQEIEEGAVLLDGQDITGRMGELLGSVSAVFQEPFLFDRCMTENIAYGETSADEKKIETFGELLNISELMDRYKEGEGIGTKGKKLSGGEQRRAAIARALYRGGKIYLMDEPTAGLDEENRDCVVRVLQELKRHAIVIVFTHDEKVTQTADRVISI